MHFMTLAHAKYSGNIDLIQQHYPILKQWADYLVNDTVYPVNQSVKLAPPRYTCMLRVVLSPRMISRADPQIRHPLQ